MKHTSYGIKENIAKQSKEPRWSDFEDERTNIKKKASTCQVEQVANGRDDSEDIFDTEMSSESRDEDGGFFEYESLSSFNLLKTETPNDIVITAQAVTISSKHVIIDKHIDNLPLDCSSGHAIVGIVREIGCGVKSIELGDRVATIVETLSNNPRYARVSADMAVKVPCGIDSAEAAAVAYTYLRAFQSINHGAPFNIRYNSNTLSRKSILIVDGTGVIGQATIQLALIAGAEKVYAIGDEDYHQSLLLSGAIPLEPSDWLSTVENKVDLVVDSVQSLYYEKFAARKALKPGGKLVCVGNPVVRTSLKSKQLMCKPFLDDILAQIDLMFLQQQEATFYDLFSDVFHYPEIMKVNICYTLFISM